MSATTFGDINFSLSDETGLYSESHTEDITAQIREIVGAGGEVLAGAVFKHTGTFSIEGAYKTTGSPTWDLATAMTLTNSVSLEDLVSGYTSGAKFILLNVSAPLGVEAEERRNLSGNIYPFLPAAN